MILLTLSHKKIIKDLNRTLLSMSALTMDEGVWIRQLNL